MIMEKILLIKYYYTCQNQEFLLPQIQIRVEDILENYFQDDDVSVYFHFLNTSNSAYYHDFIEVEHSFPLTEKVKNDLFSLIRENVGFFPDIENIEDAELLQELSDQNHYLKFALFRKIAQSNMIINDFDE